VLTRLGQSYQSSRSWFLRFAIGFVQSVSIRKTVVTKRFHITKRPFTPRRAVRHQSWPSFTEAGDFHRSVHHHQAGRSSQGGPSSRAGRSSPSGPTSRAGPTSPTGPNISPDAYAGSKSYCHDQNALLLRVGLRHG